MNSLLKVVCTASAVVSLMVGTAGGASAADAGTMPDVTGEILQDAVADVQSAVGSAKVDITYAPPTDQVVYNLSNWHVCDTDPKAGDSIPQKSPEVTLSIERLNVACS
jgi:beta-lactam-binding protein with PASTA domain